MIDITILRAMAAAGATVDMILAAVEAAQKTEAEKIAARRAKDAERQRLSRGVTRTHAESQPVRNVTNGHSDKSCSYLEEDRKIEPKKEATQPKPRGTRLPSDWKPSQTDFEFAHAKGMPHDRIATEAEKFRNYWTAKSGATATKLDWPATWRNWVMSSLERQPGNPPTPPPNAAAELRRPPWEREGITETAWRERELAKINGTKIRGDPRVGESR